MDVGPREILLTVAAVAHLFGAERLPEIARSLGRARTELRKGLEEGERSASKPDSAEPDEGQVEQDRLAPGPGA